MRLILATHNAHKREELQRVLQAELAEGVELLTLDDLDTPIGDIPETGATLRENALIKARTVFEITGIPSIADDTGLEVIALEGAPGVYSARYAGETATYDDNVNKLLAALQDATNRSARFVTVICFVDRDGQERYFEGVVEGSITSVRRGAAGFGYDPVFSPAEDSDHRTFAEMTPSEKNSISHRGRALRAFAHWLRSR